MKSVRPQRKPFLIIQLRPEDETSDSEYYAFLKYGHLEEKDVCRLRVESTGIPHDLDLDKYSAIIVGGSPFDISLPQKQKATIQKRIEADFEQLFDRILPMDYPFLGACSGCGLLGHYLGAKVSNKYHENVGAKTISLTAAAKLDPLLLGFPTKIRVLLGHKESPESLPPCATLLCVGEDAPIQMFRVHKNIYATQFHPEGDPEGFATRINTYKHHGYFMADQAKEIIDAVKNEDAPYPKEILRRFVQRYKDR